MRIRAHLMMVMALDKCIGCHACSVSCKRSWTARVGSEHAWFNNVETRPGLGYPRGWDARGGLGGGAASVAAEYYEPWDYDFAGLVDAPLTEAPPAAHARSLLTGRPLKPDWGPNWDDDLAGTMWPDPGSADPGWRGLRSAGSIPPGPVRSGSTPSGPAVRPGPTTPQGPAAPPGRTSPAGRTPSSLDEEIRLRYERLFMLYLPRMCNHCLLPSCAAACKLKAIYKRSSDGIVLIDQEKCRGRRSCVTACPYKKVYVNRVTEKAEKCMFCLPGVVENGLPPLCAETCVGRIRSTGVVLYDAEAVARAAEEGSGGDLVEAQRQLLLDPRDSSVLARAEQDGVPHQWLEAAQRSPVYALAKELRVALPLRPEFKTLPMVWYVPPLSPAVESLQGAGVYPFHRDDQGPQAAAGSEPVFGSAERLRIPLDYLAGVFAAGDRAPVEEAVGTLIAMREFKRHQQIHGEDAAGAAQGRTGPGVDPNRLERLFRLVGIAERGERFVIPTARHDSGRSPDLPPGSPLRGRTGAGEEA